MRFAGLKSAAQRRRALGVGLACASAILGALVPHGADRLNPAPPPGPVQELREIFRQKRPLKARLEGFDFWEPCDKPRCTPLPLESPDFRRLAQLGGRLKTILEPNDQELRALALWHLVAPDGEIDKSVRLLGRLSQQVEGRERAMVLSDLSAAYSTRAELRSDFRDAIRALDAVEQAYAMTPVADPTRFRRIESSEAAGLYEQAAEGLRELDPRTQVAWRAELESRNSAAPRRKPWSDIEQSVFLAASAGRTADVVTMVADHVSDAFDFLETQVFDSWGAALQSGQPDSAASWAKAGSALVEALGVVADDRFWAKAIAAGPDADQLRSFAAARRAYIERNIGESNRRFSELLRVADPDGPFSLWARFYLAAGRHWGEGREGMVELAALLDLEIAVPSSRFLGHVHWMLGLFQSQWVGLAEARTSYSRAIGYLRRARHLGQVAVLHNLICDDDFRRGHVSEAFGELEGVLRERHLIGSAGHAATVLEVAQEAALRIGATHAALAFQHSAVDLANQFGLTWAQAEKYADRASLFALLDRRQEAVADLRAASRAAALAGDQTSRPLLEARLLLAESRAFPTQPVDGDRLASAIELFSESTGISFLPGLLALEARQLFERGDGERARQRWIDAVDALDDLYGGGFQEMAGPGFARETAQVVDEVVAGLLGLHDSSAALWAADRLRYWDVSAARGPRFDEFNRFALAKPDREVVYLHFLPDGVVRWHLTVKGLETKWLPVPRTQWTTWASRWLAGRRGDFEAAVSEIVGDGGGAVVPELGLLVDPRFDLVSSGRLARSLGRRIVALASLSLTPVEPVPSPHRVLVVGDPFTHGEMSPLPGALAQARRMSSYAGNEVLTGRDASRSRVVEGLQLSRAFVFLGHFGADRGGVEGLLVGRDDESGGEALTRREIRGLRAVPALVILAACDNPSLERAGEGLRGLALEFVRRGAARVLFSRDAVDDLTGMSSDGDLASLVSRLEEDSRFDDLRRLVVQEGILDAAAND